MKNPKILKYPSLLAVTVSVLFSCGKNVPTSYSYSSDAAISEESMFSSAVSSEEEKIQIVSEKRGGIVPFMNDVLQGYLDLSPEDSLDYLKENNYRATGDANDGQNARIVWSGGNGPYTLLISEHQDLSDPIIRKTENRGFYPGTLNPDTKYYFQVTDSQGMKSDFSSFTTGDGVRVISAREKLSANGVNNVRDLGGWKTEDGKRVRFDRVFRGGMLISSSVPSYEMDDYGREVFTELGIRTEIDFRTTGELGGQTGAAVDGWNYLNLPYLPYNAIYPEENNPSCPVHDANAKNVIRQVFEEMSDEKNYPFYIHCYAGMDRTGTMAYLINGLLGVSEEDLLRDYELSAFSKICYMYRGTSFYYTCTNENGTSVYYSEEDTWNKFTAFMKNTYSTGDGKLSSCIRNFLMKECSVSETTLNTVISLMVE